MSVTQYEIMIFMMLPAMLFLTSHKSIICVSDILIFYILVEM